MLNNLINQCKADDEQLSELFTFIWADYAAREDLHILKLLGHQTQTELDKRGINVYIDLAMATLQEVKLTRYAVKVIFTFSVSFSNEGEHMPIIAEFHFNRKEMTKHSKIAFTSGNARTSRMRYLVTNYQVHELFNKFFKNLIRGKQ